MQNSDYEYLKFRENIRTIVTEQVKEQLKDYNPSVSVEKHLLQK